MKRSAARMKTSRKSEAVKSLLETLQVAPGESVYTKTVSVSRSGMSRLIDVYIMRENAPRCISRTVSDAVGWGYGKHGGVRVSGCGMDMGFHLVYTLSRALFPQGFDCLGERCPSNDHSNARFYRGQEVPTHHKEGGYALCHHWL